MPTRFLKSWIEAHYLERVASVYRSEDADVARVLVGVRTTCREGTGKVGQDDPRRTEQVAAPAC